MDGMLKFLEKFANAKGIVLLIVLALVIFFIVKNIDFITEVTFKIDRTPKKENISFDSSKVSKSDSKKDSSISKYHKQSADTLGSPSFIIKDVSLCPIDFTMPNYFYFEIKNEGIGDAINSVLTIDFGKGNILAYEIRPTNSYEIISADSGQNVAKIRFPLIKKNESIYFYAQLSTPTFKNIKIASKLFYDEFNYTVEEYNSSTKEEKFISGGLLTFLRLLAGGVILVFVIFLVSAILKFLNKFAKL